MVLSSAALRLYIRYKAHSSDLFKDITASARDLGNFQQWTANEKGEYETWISSGFIRNLICHGARTKFRELYVPAHQRDGAHEKAIRSAEENCATYARLYAELQAAKGRGSCSDAKSHSDTDSDNEQEPRSEPAAPKATTAPLQRRKSAELAKRQVEEEDIIRAWKLAMKERADAETEAERVVLRLFERCVVFLNRLRVDDDETLSILAGALYDLAPKAVKKKLVQLNEQEARNGLVPDPRPRIRNADCEFSWWDSNFLAELKKREDISDEGLEKILLASTIEHRTVCPKVSRPRVRVTRLGGSWITKLQKAGADVQRLNLSADVALLLGVIGELKPQRCMGDYLVRVDLISSYRGVVAEYARTGVMPPVELSGASHLQKDVIDSRTMLATLYAEGHVHPSVGPPSLRKDKTFRQLLRCLRPLLRKNKCEEADVAVRALTRFLDGTVKLPLVLLHPAQFLRDVSGPVTEFGASIARSMARDMDEDYMRHILLEVETVLFTAAALMSVQYHEHDGTYTPGKAPKWMAEKNPFDDPGHMIYAAAAARKSGIIDVAHRGQFEMRKLPPGRVCK